jgi:hypothetical protein
MHAKILKNHVQNKELKQQKKISAEIEEHPRNEVINVQQLRSELENGLKEIETYNYQYQFDPAFFGQLKGACNRVRTGFIRGVKHDDEWHEVKPAIHDEPGDKEGQGP